jgi:predicted GNAT family N-acyltransferase
MDVYRVTAESPPWMLKAYDYVRIDAFCFGQSIPIELEFSHDESPQEIQAVLVAENHKPIAGCRIYYPEPGVGKIGRVCVIRERQRSGVGRVLMKEAENWIASEGVRHIVISSQDRAADFYFKIGYVLNEKDDPWKYDHIPANDPPARDVPPPAIPDLGFSCVLVEKYLDL